MPQRVILYGASGFLGSHIHKALLLYCDVIGTGFKNVPKYLTYSDATKRKMVEEDLLGCMPDYVIFAAGNKNLKAPYRELYRDNVLPMKNIYSVIKEHKLKTRVIFISTDAVFNGLNGYHQDSEVPQPTNNYGKTKYLAEQALEPNPLSHGMVNPVDYRIIRTSAVIGKGSLFLTWLIENFKLGSFKVYSNVFLSPTSIELLTNSIIYIIENWDKVRQPIIHICGKRMSRYQFARLVGRAGNHTANVFKDNDSPACDTSMIPSDIQKKIIHKPMKEFLCSIV